MLRKGHILAISVVTISLVTVLSIDAQNDIDSMSVNELLKQGQELLDQGNHEESMLYFEKAMKIDPNERSIFNNIGVSLQSYGRYEEALLWLDKALEINPNDSSAWSNKANTLFQLERYEEAIVFFDKTFEARPDDLSVNNMNKYGLSLLALGKYDEAIVWFDKVLEKDPNYEPAKINKELAQNPILGFLVNWSDLIFQLALVGIILGGSYLVNRIRKHRKRFSTPSTRGILPKGFENS